MSDKRSGSKDELVKTIHLLKFTKRRGKVFPFIRFEVLFRPLKTTVFKDTEELMSDTQVVVSVSSLLRVTEFKVSSTVCHLCSFF